MSPTTTVELTPVADRRAEIDHFTFAVDSAILRLVNIERALRRQPAAIALSDLHPDVIDAYRASAIEAVLYRQPAAMLEAINDTAEELQKFVEKLLTNPDHFAVCNDVDLMKDACRAFVRVQLWTFRESLAGQLAILRCTEEAE